MLLPKASFEAAKIKITLVISTITDSMQNARKAAAIGNTLVATEVSKATAYTRMVQQLRLKDQYKFVYKSLSNSPGYSSLVSKQDDILYPNGEVLSDYTTIDVDATLAAGTDATSAQESAFIRKFKTWAASRATKAHQSLIEEFKMSQDTISTDITKRTT